MWWLAYRRDGQALILLLKARSLMHARMLAAVTELDANTTFQEGHELDPPRARRVPKAYVGKPLGKREAQRLLSKLA